MVFKTPLLCLLAFFISSAYSQVSKRNPSYPTHWWLKVNEEDRRGAWEILPQEANKGEVILSKRNELGVFSNFANTPFIFEGVHYASIEGLWQMMKYPDPYLLGDQRFQLANYPYTRSEVKDLFGFEAKSAGTFANKVMKKNSIKWISYNDLKFNYKDFKAGSKLHYKIIKNAIIQKLIQNPKLIKLLLKTKGLILRPDHLQGSNKPRSYFYHEILMEYRATL